jgi:hypothetical protein
MNPAASSILIGRAQVDGWRRMRSAWRKSEARVEMETGRMNVAMEADRELLWALLRRRAEELPTVALGAAAATFAELASTTARLLAAGPTHPDEEPLPEADVPRVLAARDAVVGGCARAGRHPRRGTPGADADLRPGHLVSDPAYVLHDALRARPAVASWRVAPSELLGTGRDAWAKASL